MEALRSLIYPHTPQQMQTSRPLHKSTAPTTSNPSKIVEVRVVGSFQVIPGSKVQQTKVLGATSGSAMRDRARTTIECDSGYSVTAMSGIPQIHSLSESL